MNTTAGKLNPESVTLTAADGYSVAATRFRAQGSPRGCLIVAGATGVPQFFYRRFAEFASSRGFTSLTLDYRGIGKSRPVSLKGFKANFLDWAELDLAAAVDEMAADTVPLFMVGHSFGGHAFGLLPNHHCVEGLYTFATGSGWHGWMPLIESWRIRLLWNVVFPILTRWKGYLPGAMLGMGADVPLGVYRQWRRWCGFPRYFFDDPGMPRIAEKFSRVRTPIVAANALDDRWALPNSRDAFIQAYCNAPVKRIDLDPVACSGSIGHMGYFRQINRRLWDDVFQWFNQQLFLQKAEPETMERAGIALEFHNSPV